MSDLFLWLYLSSYILYKIIGLIMFLWALLSINENPRKEYLRLHLGLKCRFEFSKTHIHVIFKFESEVLVILFNP